MKLRNRLVAILGCLLLGNGCTEQVAPDSERLVSVATVDAEKATIHPLSSSWEDMLQEQPEASVQWLQNEYIQSLADEVVAQLSTGATDDLQKVYAAYEYLVGNEYFSDPIGLDCWRYRAVRVAPAPPFLENRVLSPLAFGVGSCEDYAAAMTLLLRGMGLNARYLPGLTIASDRSYTDHAWTLVELDGSWYHLDPQLERNVMQGDQLTYRFF